MSEPSLLAAFIPLTLESYARFVKAEGAHFAEAAASIVADGQQDWLILRYLKTEEALFVAYIFNWADRSDAITARPYYEALLRAANYMSDGATGRVLISADAMNCTRDELELVLTLSKANGAARERGLTDDDKRAFNTLLDTDMFGAKIYQQSYQEMMGKPAVLDKTIRRQALAIIEARGRAIALERVPAATLLAPVRLFEKYHYNGHFMLFEGRSPLIGFDPLTTVQRPWGACDCAHAAIGRHVVATDPSAFCVVSTKGGEGGTVYRDAQHVYAPDGRIIPGADPATIKFAGGFFLRDAERWFTIEGTPLDGAGPDARVDNSLYYWRNALLIGAPAVYMGSQRLPLDGASTIVRHTERRTVQRQREVRLAWLTDRDGDLVVYDSASLDGPIIERTDRPERRLGELATRTVLDDVPPRLAAVEAFEEVAQSLGQDDEGPTALADYAAKWLAQNSELYLREDPFNGRFWSVVVQCVGALRQQSRHSELLTLVATIHADAWIEPSVYRQTAVARVALGQHEEAIDDVRLALACNASDIDQLFDDAALAALFDDKTFRSLKAYRAAAKGQHRTFLPDAVLRSIAAKSEKVGDVGSGSGLGRSSVARSVTGLDIGFVIGLGSLLTTRYYIPDEAAIVQGFPDAVTRETYRSLLISTADAIVRANLRDDYPPYIDVGFYRGICTIPGLSAAVHLAGALDLFADGWFWVDVKRDDRKTRPEFTEAVAALGRMGKALIASPNSADNSLWADVSNHPAASPYVALAEALRIE